MKRADLEHILRASKGATGEAEFIIVGSQSILGRHPDAPRVLRQSMELDIYPKHRPELAPDIDGSLGELSQFDTTFGYYADGVGPETATLPADWEARLVKVENDNTGGAKGWCLDPHDLAYAKLAARREKDIAFVANLLRHNLVKPSRVEALIAAADAPLRERLAEAWAICRARAAKQGAG